MVPSSKFVGLAPGFALCAALALGACASSPKQPKQESGTERAVDKTREGFSDAASAPLRDLNLQKEEIPERLGAIRSPYEPIKQRDCVGINVEVIELTNILGPDSDAPPDGTTDSQRRGDQAANIALGQVSSAASDFIPFRSLVRMATGASAHDRRLREAFQNGQLRRAYLKGVGASLGCSPPAAPEPNAGAPPPAGPAVEYRGNQPASSPRP